MNKMGQRIFVNTILFAVLLTVILPAAEARKGELQKAAALHRQSKKLNQQGRHLEALTTAKKAISIREEILGPDHPKVAQCLNRLSEIHKSLGEYETALLLCKRALAIRQKKLDAFHPAVAQSLNQMGAIYRSLGKYAKAAPLYKRALTIRRKTLGPDHPNVAKSLNNLAVLHRVLGNYQKAEALCRLSLDIHEKHYGPEHPHVAKSLNNLAAIFRVAGHYQKAIPLCRRALEIYEKTRGADHPRIANSLNNLANIYRAIGKYTESESFSKRAIDIYERVKGTEHHRVAQSLNNLAALYREVGRYQEALPICQRALHIYEKTYGPDHPNVAKTLNNLAILNAAMGNYSTSHELFFKAQKIDTRMIEQIMGFTNEGQKIKFLSKKKKDLHLFLSLVSRHLSDNNASRRDALDVWLRRKGVILEAQRRYQEALAFSDDPGARSDFKQLSRIRARISNLVFGAPEVENPDAAMHRFAELKRQKNLLEAKLSKVSRAFALKKREDSADSRRVAAVLPPHTVLLEFAKVSIFNFKATGNQKYWQPARYIVFILHAGKGEHVQLVDLGSSEIIDNKIIAFKKAMSHINDIQPDMIKKTSGNIHDLVFAPIKPELEGINHIFIAPDGHLNLIPFEVLCRPDGSYLIENYTFNYLSTGRDLLRFAQIADKGSKALLLGDPDFDSIIGEKNPKAMESYPKGTTLKGRMRPTTEQRRLQFTRLPGSREEVEAIRDILGENNSVLYLGKDAREGVLRNNPSPRWLHLSTHGFFLGDRDLTRVQPKALDEETTDFEVQTPAGEVWIQNPLLRSGIALAGANRTIGARDADESDGILTAEKILGLRLWGTDMVVLSACETGLGQVHTGEGVYGLRRAFIQAGAKSMVMSMWQVPDDETKELMVQFYRLIQSGKMNRCLALRQAALKEMKIVRERYGDAHPFFWGAFIFLGEP
jgi:CHAT domain-containing protein/tetratricopeptide (TPR) repeat protein